MPIKQTIDAKMIQKRSSVPGEIPTVPVSNDHTDGSWNATDIYSGELFLNEADISLFTRIDTTIYEIGINRGIEKDDFELGSDQAIFPLTKNILSKFAVFEDGVLTIKSVAKTGAKELTVTPDIPSGTNVSIIY